MLFSIRLGVLTRDVLEVLDEDRSTFSLEEGTWDEGVVGLHLGIRHNPGLVSGQPFIVLRVVGP